MVNILVTGCNGQLGNEFRVIANDFPHFNFLFTDIADLDITNEKLVKDYFEVNNPDVVINCAGYTAVDKAETEPESAMLLNRDAVANLTGSCVEHDSFLVHFSTDYVFNGVNSQPYREDDIPSPVSVYGITKLEGEEAMLSCLQKGLIIRTSWLYSSFGNNFVKTILRKSAETGMLRVVSDQIGSPTYARDLALAILTILPKALTLNELQILHYSNEGKCSWYDFARKITDLAGIHCEITPVGTNEYPSPALRPAYSLLDKSKIKKLYELQIPDWKDSLARCINEIKRRA